MLNNVKQTNPRLKFLWLTLLLHTSPLMKGHFRDFAMPAHTMMGPHAYL